MSPETKSETKNEWWLDFFDGVQSECALTDNAAEVVRFIEQHCGLTKSSTVLDLCCGKGTMAHEFFKAGWIATGVDMSAFFIQFAQQQFQNENCHFLQADACKFRTVQPVDLVVNWNTSFAYSEDDAENMRMLSAISDNLAAGGKFVIATLNPDYVTANFQRFIVKYIRYQESYIVAIRESFLKNRMLCSDWQFIFPDGERKTRFGQTKMYNLVDFNTMLSRHDLLIENVYGDLDGSQFKPYSPSLILMGRKV